MSKSGLSKIRLEEMLPPLGDDPGLEAHANHFFWTRNDYCVRMLDFLSPSSWYDPITGALSLSGILNFAKKAIRVTLLRVRFYEVGNEVRWEVGPQTLMQALGDDFDLALYVRNAMAVERFEAFVARYLGDIRDQAVARTAASILALMLAFARLTSQLADPVTGFRRRVDALIRRVLAAGGQTAVFAPLT